MGFDLRKTLGLYNAERELRKQQETVKLFTSLLGIDPEHLIENQVNVTLGKVITKKDAANLAAILKKYAES